MVYKIYLFICTKFRVEKKMVNLGKKKKKQHLVAKG